MSAAELASHSILVVDDDEVLNELFCQFLQGKGFETDSAYSLVGAIKIILDSEKFDLILLDYQLGDGTGLEFLAELNCLGLLKRPPVIMVSGNEDPDFLQNCFNMGVDDYIIKPVNLSLLALKVSALIKSISMQRIIKTQNTELERLKREADREEAIAKFTYEYLLGQNSQRIKGVSVWLKPFAAFSGDIALARLSPGGDLYFLLADATGHGLSAAITLMPVISIFNTMVKKGFHIQSIVTEMNNKLTHDTPEDRFVAAIVIQIHHERKEIDIWNGGMPTVYWVNQGEIIKSFKSQHMALGILDGIMFDANVTTCDFPGHGTLIAYSDGLIEEMNAAGEAFTAERVEELIKIPSTNIQKVLIEALHSHAHSDQYRDDVSICTLEPNIIFTHAENFGADKKAHNNAKDEFGDFSWGMKIAGAKIARCEIPPLCNKFLQHFELNQSFCQIIFLIVSEMVSNAIDHGILKLDSAIKNEPDGFNQYFGERDKRLAALTDADFIELELAWNANAISPHLTISVRDSGDGYDFDTINVYDEDGLSGRGLQLIRSLSQRVEVVHPGNFIKAIIGPS